MQRHAYAHTHTLITRETQLTAQHSDLVSMWPRKIKHDSLRTAMGTKTWFSAFSQTSTHRRAANLPIPLPHRAVAALTAACIAEIPKQHHILRVRQEDKKNCRWEGRQEVLQVKLRVVFSLVEGRLRTGLSSQAQLQDMLQQHPPSDPHYPTPSGLHSQLQPLQVICTHREGYGWRCYHRESISITKRCFRERPARIIS